VATDNQDIKGTLIIVTNENRMTGKVKVFGVRDNDLASRITVKSHKSIQGAIYVYSDYTREGDLYGSQRKSHFYVLNRKDISGSIAITPNGSMKGVFDLLPPPKTVIKLSPVKDAFIREGIKTLNYGAEQTMLVGYSADNNERYRSLLGFDVSSIPDNQTIDKAVLKLYNSSANPIDQPIGLYSAYNTWTELGVTWKNQPFVDATVGSATVGKREGFIEFDVLDIVSKWKKHELNNNGFILKAIDETVNQYLSLYTKESSNPDLKPVLEVTYYDNNIRSIGRFQIRSSGIIKGFAYKDITGHLVIPTYDRSRELLSKIKVRNPDFVESNIFASRPYLQSNIIVQQRDKSQLISNIVVRQKRIVEIDSMLFVSVRQLKSKLGVPFTQDITSNIGVKAIGKNDLVSKIFVSRNYLQSSIIVDRRINNFRSKIQVQGTNSRDINGLITVKQVYQLTTSIFINKVIVPSNIKVVHFSDITATIRVRAIVNSDLPSNLFISRREINGNLNVRRSGRTQITGTMVIRQNDKKELLTNLFISRREVDSQITVKLISDISCQVEVKIPAKKDLNSKAYILFRKDINSNVRVIGASILRSHIFVVSGYLKSFIRIPISAHKDMNSKVYIRVKFIMTLNVR
jgi:hypothetical protein